MCARPFLLSLRQGASPGADGDPVRSNRPHSMVGGSVRWLAYLARRSVEMNGEHWGNRWLRVRRLSQPHLSYGQSLAKGRRVVKKAWALESRGRNEEAEHFRFVARLLTLRAMHERSEAAALRAADENSTAPSPVHAPGRATRARSALRPSAETGRGQFRRRRSAKDLTGAAAWRTAPLPIKQVEPVVQPKLKRMDLNLEISPCLDRSARG